MHTDPENELLVCFRFLIRIFPSLSCSVYSYSEYRFDLRLRENGVFWEAQKANWKKQTVEALNSEAMQMTFYGYENKRKTAIEHIY